MSFDKNGAQDTKNNPGTGGDQGDGGLSNDPSLKLDASVVHRLNRTEYNNAISDLFDMPLNPAKEFPEDPKTHGFDNIAENLSITTSLADQLNQASEKLAKDILNEHPRTNLDINLVAQGNAGSGTAMGQSWDIVSNLPLKFTLAQDEEMSFELGFQASASSAPVPKTKVTLDGKEVIPSTTIKIAQAESQVLTFKAGLGKGEHTINVAFDNRVNPNAPMNIFNTLVLNFVRGTSGEIVMTPAAKNLAACKSMPEPAKCQQEIYQSLAKRAWRRPLTADEKSQLDTLWKSVVTAKGSDLDAFKAIVQAVTFSSKFLFRTTNPLESDKDGISYVDGYTMASRMSFFLWGSIPDDELLEAAEKKDLSDVTKLRAQITRMLADPKSKRFTSNFTTLWMKLYELDKKVPDAKVFKDFDNDLRASLSQESQLVFNDFLTNGKPITDLLTPGFTFANDRLAKHYGMKAPGSKDSKKVMTSDNRGSILTQGSWLTATSLPGDTMPVRRGAWVMDNILCTPPPAAPSVPPIATPKDGEAPKSFRERFAKHVESPSCSGCHNIIDPIGFGMEAFDGIGALRSVDSTGKPVDVKGKILGTDFEDVDGMIKVIQQKPNFRNCINEKLYSYATGKNFSAADKIIMDSIITQAETKGLALDAIIESIILSPAFRMADFKESL